MSMNDHIYIHSYVYVLSKYIFFFMLNYYFPRKDWLRHTGSPMSKIEKCVFKNERHISKEEFTDFFIKVSCMQVQIQMFALGKT